MKDINFSMIIILLAIPICFINCNSDDKLKLELIYKIMEEPDNIDSLVMSSSFYDEKIYKRFIQDIDAKTEKVEYIKKYRGYGYYYIDNEVSLLRKMDSDEYDKMHYILLGFKEQKIGIIFSFMYDEKNNKWNFSSFGAFGLKL